MGIIGRAADKWRTSESGQFATIHYITSLHAV